MTIKTSYDICSHMQDKKHLWGVARCKESARRMEDHQMGGVYASGNTIEEALGNIRAKYDPTEDFCPVELVISK
ncbi:hypothetical protein ACP3V3_01775 [Vibrio sp. PNB22_3_1]